MARIRSKSLASGSKKVLPVRPDNTILVLHGTKRDTLRDAERHCRKNRRPLPAALLKKNLN